jgi:hypothetical protein
MIRGYRKTFVHQEESRKADKEIGEIDLLGLDIADRLWVVELKVAPNTDTPLKALYQGLRYSAIVDANRQAMSAEVLVRKGASPIWPGVIAIARRLDLLDTVGSPQPESRQLADCLEAPGRPDHLRVGRGDGPNGLGHGGD